MFLTRAAFRSRGSIISGLLAQTVCFCSDAERKIKTKIEFEFNRMSLTAANRQMV